MLGPFHAKPDHWMAGAVPTAWVSHPVLTRVAVLTAYHETVWKALPVLLRVTVKD